MNCNDCGGFLPGGCECSPFGGRRTPTRQADPTPPPGTEPNYCNAEHCTCRMGFGYVACDQQPKWKAARGVDSVDGRKRDA